MSSPSIYEHVCVGSEWSCSTSPWYWKILHLSVPHAVDLLVVDMDLLAILGQDFLLPYCHHITTTD